MTSTTNIKAATPRPVPEPGTPIGCYQEGEDIYVLVLGFPSVQVGRKCCSAGEVLFICFTKCGVYVSEFLDSICCISIRVSER